MSNIKIDFNWEIIVFDDKSCHVFAMFRMYSESVRRVIWKRWKRRYITPGSGERRGSLASVILFSSIVRFNAISPIASLAFARIAYYFHRRISRRISLKVRDGERKGGRLRATINRARLRMWLGKISGESLNFTMTCTENALHYDRALRLQSFPHCRRV